MTVEIVRPASEVIVDEEGRPTVKFFQWLGLVTDLEPLSGIGSPEGVLEARSKRIYFDLNGTTGSIAYIKLQDDIIGDRTQGWELI